MKNEQKLPFETFMGQHEPLSKLIEHIDETFWEKSSISPILKERTRIASAESLACSY